MFCSMDKLLARTLIRTYMVVKFILFSSLLLNDHHQIYFLYGEIYREKNFLMKRNQQSYKILFQGNAPNSL